jgi:Histidine kinase-, DNA gyrase B-, and HSP90-like ATPase
MDEYDIAPDTHVLLGMQNEQWTVPGALAELVDNSFGPVRGDASQVEIRWHSNDRVLTILDNGQGMDHPAALFRLGQTAGRGPGDIGKYGQGGTMACLWLGNRVAVWTVRDRKVSYAVADWDRIRRSRRWSVPVKPPARMTAENIPTLLQEIGCGTLIRIDVRPRRIFHPEVIKRELARLYAPALRLGRTLLWLDDRGHSEELVSAHDRPDLIGAFLAEVRVRLPEIELRAKLAAGLLPGERGERSGIDICYGPRIIKRSRDCFISPDGKTCYAGVGLVGYLDLDDDWPDYLIRTKSGFCDDEAEAVLNAELFRLCEPLLQQAEEQSEQIQVADLELKLAASIEGALNVDLCVRGKRARSRGEGGGVDPNPKPGPLPDLPETDEPDPTRPNGDLPLKGRPELTVKFAPATALNGCLCDPIITGNTIMVLTDRQHPAVIEARRNRDPARHWLLVALIVPPTVRRILDDPALVRKLLPARLREELAGRSGPTEQANFLTAHILKSMAVGG